MNQLFQRIGSTTREVATGAILANRMGKTFIYTGTDSQGNLCLTSTCDNRYFVRANPADFNCYEEKL